MRYSIKKYINTFDTSHFIRVSYSVFISPDYIKRINFTEKVIYSRNNQVYTISRDYLHDIYERCYGNVMFDCIGGMRIKKR